MLEEKKIETNQKDPFIVDAKKRSNLKKALLGGAAIGAGIIGLSGIANADIILKSGGNTKSLSNIVSEGVVGAGAGLGSTIRCNNANTAAGKCALAFGADNTASGATSVAVGYNNQACGDYSYAVGTGNAVTGSSGASAFGLSNLVTTDYSSAIGNSNIACGSYSTAVGYNNTASGYSSSAVGYCNVATGNQSSASGYHNATAGDTSSAHGWCNTACGTGSTAIGSYNCTLCGTGNAFGNSNCTCGTASTAVGYCNVTGTNASAFGDSMTNNCNASAQIGFMGGFINVDCACNYHFSAGWTGDACFSSGLLSYDASDERLKNINGDYCDGGCIIQQIQPIRYNWKDRLNNTSEKVGFSAQNVQTVIPEAVNEQPNGYLGLVDRPIIAALVNAVKELQQRVKELENAQV